MALEELTDSAPPPQPEAPIESQQPAAPPIESSAPESAQPAAPESWLTPEYRELAASYGMGDDEVKEFGSAAEFQRAARYLDRQLADFSKQPSQPPAAHPPAQPSVPAAPASAAEAAQALSLGKLERLDIEKLRAAGYDDDALTHFAKQNEVIDRHNALVDHLEKRSAAEKAFEDRFGKLEHGFSQFQEILVRSEAQRRVNAFHDAVDGLNDSRFGKTVDEQGRPLQITVEQDNARRQLHEAVATITNGILRRAEMTGQPPQMPSDAVLLRRAREFAFAEQIRAEERKKLQDKIAEQSKLRRPVATSRGPDGRFAPQTDKPLSPREYVAAVANSPEVDAAWQKALEASGAAV